MSKKKKLVEYFGNLNDSDGRKDVAFWRSCSSEERFSAAWELIEYYYRSKGLGDELRFSRNIETVGKMESRVCDNRRIRRNGILRTTRN